jgi:hypothetical protein
MKTVHFIARIHAAVERKGDLRSGRAAGSGDPRRARSHASSGRAAGSGDPRRARSHASGTRRGPKTRAERSAVLRRIETAYPSHNLHNLHFPRLALE